VVLVIPARLQHTTSEGRGVPRGVQRLIGEETSLCRAGPQGRGKLPDSAIVTGGEDLRDSW
jgi:hypothetical protein